MPRLSRWALWVGAVLLLFMSLLRIFFFYYFNPRDLSITEMLPSFWMGFRYDLRAAGIVMLIMLISGLTRYSHPFRNHNGAKGWMLLLWFLSLAIIFFYVVDFAHYAYLSQRLNASVLGYLEDTSISAEMVWQSYPVIRLFLLIFLLATGLFYMFRLGFKKINKNTEPSFSRGRRAAISTIFSLCCIFFIFGRLNQYPLRWSDAFRMGSDYQANLALNPFESFFNTIRYRGKTFDIKAVQEYYQPLSKYYGYAPSGMGRLDYTRSVVADTMRKQHQPNVILVICESFSAYKSSMWGNPLNATPFFDSLSRNGIFFDRCFTPTYGTARGVWATMTGLPDVDIRQTASRNPAAVDQQMIISQFDGYEKYYFIGGSPSWANIRGLLMNNIPGLHLYEEENLRSPRLDVWGVSDKNLFLEATSILGEEKRPFFAVIQTADNHRPYSIPSEDTDFMLRHPAEDSLDRFGFKDQVSYDLKLKEFNAFRYTDYTFKKFIEAARRQPFFDETLFVFIGDHGIPGEVGNMFPPAWTDKRLTALHVPLLFYAPKWLSPQRKDMICSQVDVMPTIAGLCNVSYLNTALGRDLLQPGHEPYAFIFDPDFRKIGLLKGDFFYRAQLDQRNEELMPIKANAIPPSGIPDEYRTLTKAIHQTAGYLLVNNKKQKRRY